MKAAMVLGIMEDDDEKLRIKRDVLNNKNAGCTVDWEKNAQDIVHSAT